MGLESLPFRSDVTEWQTDTTVLYADISAVGL